MTAMGDSWDDEDGDDDYAELGDVVFQERSPDDVEPELVTTVLFTASNPSGTVSVSTMINGQAVRVDLSSDVVRMTESQLSEEITVISKIAGRQALAAQHALAGEMMRKLGHDNASTRGFLETELGLPSPERVLAEKHEVFRSRYSDEHE